MCINDYSVYQSIQSESVSIFNESIKTGKICKSGMSYTKYSSNCKIFFSSNDFSLGKLANNTHAFKITDDVAQLFRERDRKWIASELNISDSLPSLLRNYVSRLGTIEQISIEATGTDRFDMLSRNPDDVISNRQTWVMADIRIAIQKDGMVWEINRQTGTQNGRLSDNTLLEYIKTLADTYQPYADLPLGNIDSECEYDLILPHGQGGILIHEAVGHALEADCFFEENSVLNNYFEKKIAPSHITVYDAPFLSGTNDANHSDDGSPSTDSIELINNGFVTGILSDLKTAKQWKIRNTGNGRSESFSHLCIPRMRNTFMSNGVESFENIIKTTRQGVYALDIGGGQVNLQNGDFLFNITNGVFIENGVPTKRTMPFIFRGNILKTLHQIDLVGNDLSFHHAMCGKKGQFVPVSYGQPTVRILSQHLGG